MTNGGSDEERARVAAAVDEACRTVGFVHAPVLSAPQFVADAVLTFISADASSSHG